MADLVEVTSRSVHRSSAIDKMDFHRLKFLDLHNPSPEDIADVCDIIKVSRLELSAFLDKDEMPRVAKAGGFLVMVLRVPVQRSKSSSVGTTSLTFFFSERLLIAVHKEPIPFIQDFLELPDEEVHRLLGSGTSELLYYLIHCFANEFFHNLDGVEAAIDRIETSVFNHPDQKTVKQIFSLKRTLIYFHKALSADRDVLVALQKQGEGFIQPEVLTRMTQLYYDVVQLLDVVATYRDILTGSLDIYLSAVSNNMNAVMKKMAAYGTLVLVPTFITGLYGMNFAFMPELSWKYGYVFVWSVIILSMVALWWYFRKKDWF